MEHRLILEYVATSFNTTVDAIKKTKQKRDVELVLCRQTYYWICKRLKENTLINGSLSVWAKEIGQDHATALHSAKTIENYCETNAKMKAKFYKMLDDSKAFVQLDFNAIPQY